MPLLTKKEKYFVEKYFELKSNSALKVYLKNRKYNSR